MAISGHRCEVTLINYNARPSSEKLRACSDILTGTLNIRPQESRHPSFTDAVTSSSLLPMNPTPTVVHSRKTAQHFVKYQPQALSSLFCKGTGFHGSEFGRISLKILLFDPVLELKNHN